MPDLSTYLRQSSLTYSDVVRDLTNYVESLPEGSKPKDLFIGSEGKLIIDYLAAEHSDIAYKVIMGFCENYLLYANKIENIIANAESKGYNVRRGKNATLRISFIPSVNSKIGYLDQVGTLGEDYLLYSLEDRDDMVAGVQTTLDVVVGIRKEVTYVVNNPEQLVYRFTNPNVSDHIRVYVDTDIPVDFTTDPTQALYGRLCAMTNSYGAIDLLDFSALEAAKDMQIYKDYAIIPGSVLKVQYIELATIKYEGAIGTFSLGSVSSVVQTSTGVSPDQPVEIQKNAMLYQQTQNRVVARRDYKKVTQLHVDGILNTNDKDYSPSTVAVTYLMKDGKPMTSAAIEDLYAYLNESRTAGIPLPLLVESNPVELKLKAYVSLESYVEVDTLNEKFAAEYKTFSYQPGMVVSFNDIEKACEQVESVKNVRFGFISEEFPAGEYCPLGTVIQPGNGNAYIACAYAYSSGQYEPYWRSARTPGQLIQDGSITWKCVLFESAPKWEPNKIYNQGQVIIPSNANGYAYEAMVAQSLTGDSQPDTEGYDGDILWKLTAYDSTKPYWRAFESISYGDIRNFSTITGYSMVASGIRKKAPEEDPVWDENAWYTLVGNIMFMRIPLDGEVIAKDAVLELPWNSYLVVDGSVN